MKTVVNPKASRKTLRVSLLGTYTVDLLTSYLGPELEKLGWHPEFYVGGFSQYQQEILDDQSDFFKSSPEVTFLLLEGEDLFRDIYENPLDYSMEAKRERIQEAIKTLSDIVRKINDQTPANTIFVNNIAAPPVSVLGLLESNPSYSLRTFVREYNQNLEQLVKDNLRLYILDQESLMARLGSAHWKDERMWYLAKIPFTDSTLSQMASFYASHVKALKGMAKKCLVLDLDNTLWGGVIGEDGPEKIQLGHEGVGQAYRDFQKALLNLHKTGVLLAISSKNDAPTTLEAIERHPDMVLKKEHFAVMKIDWRDKAAHLKEIARELNLGLDSLVFIDDNPFEKDLVKTQLPEVTVVDLPEDPSYYKRTLLSLDLFNKLTLTEEDQKRGQVYREQTLREDLKQSSSSLPEFYRSLHMHALIKKADSFSIPRIAQLTQKTNQFNLTTHRCTEAEIRSLSHSETHEVYYLQLIDKFGDNGIVGVALLQKNGQEWKIDTFLLSCRVIGRTVETAFLAFLVEQARKAGAKSMLGEYIPTEKNSPCKDFYSTHGFQKVPKNNRLWRLHIIQKNIQAPTWIKINEEHKK